MGDTHRPSPPVLPMDRRPGSGEHGGCAGGSGALLPGHQGQRPGLRQWSGGAHNVEGILDLCLLQILLQTAAKASIRISALGHAGMAGGEHLQLVRWILGPTPHEGMLVGCVSAKACPQHKPGRSCTPSNSSVSRAAVPFLPAREDPRRLMPPPAAAAATAGWTSPRGEPSTCCMSHSPTTAACRGPPGDTAASCSGCIQLGCQRPGLAACGPATTAVAVAVGAWQAGCAGLLAETLTRAAAALTGHGWAMPLLLLLPCPVCFRSDLPVRLSLWCRPSHSQQQM